MRIPRHPAGAELESWREELVNQARAIAKNTAFLALARILERAANVALVLVIARALGASGVGVYSAAIAFVSLLAIAGEAGASNLLVREIAKDRSQTSTYFVHLGAMAIVIATAIVALTWAVVPHVDLSEDLRRGFLVATLAIVPVTVNAIQESILVAHQRVEIQTGVTFLASLAMIGATIALVATGHGVASLITAFAAVQWFVMVAYSTAIHLFVTQLSLRFRFRTARRLVGEAKAFAGLSLLGAVYGQPELLMLSLIASEAQTGYYAAALKIVNLYQIVPQTFMINVFPVLSRTFHAAQARVAEISEKSIKYLLAVALPVTVALVVAAEPIVRLLYGSEFEPAVTVLRILAVCIPLFSTNSVFWRVLVAQGRQGELLRALLIGVATRLTAATLLIVWLGAVGAAISVPVALVLYNALLRVRVRRGGLHLQVFRLGERFGAAAVVTGGVIWVLVDALELSYLVPLTAIVYAALLRPLRAFSASDRALLRSIWRPHGAR